MPCYNEEEALPSLYRRLTDAARTWQETYEVIVVDDGSTDSSWAMLTEIVRNDPRWKALRFSRNFGHQAAVSAGLFHASGDAIITIDADLQDPPETLGEFIAKWREGFQVVFGVRRGRKENAIKRSLYHLFYRLLSLLADIDIPRDSGDFSLIDRSVLKALNSLPERQRFVRGLRAWVGFRQYGLEYERGPRSAGEAKYSFRKLLRLAIDGVFSFSIVPLRLLTFTGLGLSVATFLGAMVYLARRLVTQDPVEGFATMIISILFLGGIQLVGVGVLGEYVGRIYEEVKGRPLWIAEASLGLPTTPARVPDPLPQALGNEVSVSVPHDHE